MVPQHGESTQGHLFTSKSLILCHVNCISIKTVLILKTVNDCSVCIEMVTVASSGGTGGSLQACPLYTLVNHGTNVLTQLTQRNDKLYSPTWKKH